MLSYRNLLKMDFVHPNILCQINYRFQSSIILDAFNYQLRVKVSIHSRLVHSVSYVILYRTTLLVIPDPAHEGVIESFATLSASQSSNFVLRIC